MICVNLVCQTLLETSEKLRLSSRPSIIMAERCYRPLHIHT